MESYREVKEVGNAFLPLRFYNIRTDESYRSMVEVLSGFGTELQTEICNKYSGMSQKHRHCLIPHWHSYFEIIYMVEGKADMRLNSECFEVDTGEIILVDAYDIHSLLGYCRHLVIQIDPLQIFQIKENFEDIFPKTHEGKWLKTDGSGNVLLGILVDRINEIYSLYTSKPHGYPLRIMGRIYEMLGLIQNHGFAADRKMFGRFPEKEALANLRRILDFVNNHYSRAITIEEIARAVNFSPNYFCRFFKKYMGKTFSDYLRDYRCIKAEALLGTTDKTVTEIALEVGFGSVSYFDKVYKKIKGHTPSAEKRLPQEPGTRRK